MSQSPECWAICSGARAPALDFCQIVSLLAPPPIKGASSSGGELKAWPRLRSLPASRFVAPFSGAVVSGRVSFVSLVSLVSLVASRLAQCEIERVSSSGTSFRKASRRCTLAPCLARPPARPDLLLSRRVAFGTRQARRTGGPARLLRNTRSLRKFCATCWRRRRRRQFLFLFQPPPGPLQANKTFRAGAHATSGRSFWARASACISRLARAKIIHETREPG